MEYIDRLAMRKTTTQFAVAMFCLLLAFQSHAQDNLLSEDDVPMSLQGYFYSAYKNAEEVQWASVDNIGQTLFRVTFSMSDEEKNVLLDSDGNLQEEISIKKKDNIDFIMSNKSLEKYPEAKVLALRKVTKFNLQGVSTPQSYFEMSLKNGRDIVYVYFDQDKQLMTNENVFNLAVN